MVQRAKARLAVLVSGRGSHLLNLHRACESESLNAKVVLVVTNQPNCGAMQIALDQGLERSALPSAKRSSEESIDLALRALLQRHDIDWVITAGYLKKIGPLTLAAFDNRVINIHPSLLPKYGGQGMYGRHVHEAVIAAGERESGASVHYVNACFDSGAVIAQSSIAINEGMTAEALAERVLKVEHALLLSTLKGLLNVNE
ncbi:MAG: phosphoribosylglycinamide formyltransferase [Pseudomonadales bacterium]